MLLDVIFKVKYIPKLSFLVFYVYKAYLIKK